MYQYRNGPVRAGWLHNLKDFSFYKQSRPPIKRVALIMIDGLLLYFLLAYEDDNNSCNGSGSYDHSTDDPHPGGPADDLIGLR